MEKNEPPWARNIQQIIVLGRGIPSYSKNLGRYAYCIAGKGSDERWYRLYPIPLEDTVRSFQPFDTIKPFVVRRNDDGRPESCRVDPHLIWKAGVLEQAKRAEYINNRVENGSFLHDDSWQTKTLGLIRPSLVGFSVSEQPTIKYYCSYQDCHGHTARFFDVLRIEKKQEKLIAPAQMLNDALSEVDCGTLRFVVGTLRSHQPRWIIVETLICLNGTVESLQSWIISKFSQKLDPKLRLLSSPP
jgi:hypothetical protein